MAHKVYCYVDETGQDTQGKFFIVGVVVATGEDQGQMIHTCEAIESRTGKGRVKWTKTRKDKRWAYMEEILRTPVFHGRLFVAHYKNTQDYLTATVDAIARVLGVILAEEAREKTRIIVLIDALPKKHIQRVRHSLRNRGHQVKKVRGVRHERGDALIRLADALCGFARDAYTIEGAPRLWERAIALGYIREVGP